MNTAEYDLSADMDLKSPEQLESFLRKLKHLLGCGALKHISRQNSSVASIDFEQFDESGPWPDVFDEEFVDIQGYRYHLFVDSYHGVGGKWTRCDRD